MYINLKKILSILMFGLIVSNPDCVDNRYIDYLYDVGIDYGIQYGQNINENIFGQQFNQNLFMDIYYPNDDNFNEKPLIFFLFGGSFVSGSRASSDIVALCNKYASMGYVAVAIDYRLSEFLLFTNPSEENGYKAVIKAIHDLKAAIRYFKKNDQIYDDYGIDSNRVFAGGYSAGAFASINAAYLNDYYELPQFILDDYEQIGGLEGLSGNQGYNSSFHGVINLSGAVGNSNWIVEGDIPIVSMHGDLDDVVPYANNLITLFGLNIQVDGSYIIHQRMLNLGNYSQLHTYQNQGHNPYTNMDYEATFSSNFIYDIICSDSIVGDINSDSSVNIQDVILLVNLILNGEFNLIADINSDSSVNIQDVILLVNLILNNY